MFHFIQTLFKLLQRKLRRPTFLCFSSQINIPHAYYLCSLLVFTWMVLGKKFCNVYQGHFRFGDYPDLICYRKQEILVKNVDFFLESPQICISMLVYDRNLVSVSASESKLFLPKPKLFPQIFLMLFVPCLEYFLCHTELSCKTFFNYLSNFHWLVCISELLTFNVLVIDMTQKRNCRTHNIRLSN